MVGLTAPHLTQQISLGSGQVLGKEIEGALARELGGSLIVSTALVAIETVVGLIHKHLHAGLRRFE